MCSVLVLWGAFFALGAFGPIFYITRKLFWFLGFVPSSHAAASMLLDYKPNLTIPRVANEWPSGLRVRRVMSSIFTEVELIHAWFLIQMHEI